MQWKDIANRTVSKLTWSPLHCEIHGCPASQRVPGGSEAPPPFACPACTVFVRETDVLYAPDPALLSLHGQMLAVEAFQCKD